MGQCLGSAGLKFGEKTQIRVRVSVLGLQLGLPCYGYAVKVMVRVRG